MERTTYQIKLLVVEDSEDLIEVWKILFREAGFAARFVDSGAHALALIEQGYRPDVVVTDYYLPDKTGLEVIGQIREWGVRAGCLLITGNKDAAFARAAKDKGVTIIHKPASFDEIEAGIRDVYRGSSASLPHAADGVAGGS